MKHHRKKSLFLIFLLLVLLSTLVSGCSKSDTELSATSNNIKWEYKVISFYDQAVGPFYNPSQNTISGGSTGSLSEDSVNAVLESTMNQLGADGWELVGFTGDGVSVSTVMIFKRMK